MSINYLEEARTARYEGNEVFEHICEETLPSMATFLPTLLLLLLILLFYYYYYFGELKFTWLVPFVVGSSLSAVAFDCITSN